MAKHFGHASKNEAGIDNKTTARRIGCRYRPLGRPFSEEKNEKDLVRKELARVRATAMEGSFGTQKEHYDLRWVKARTKLTEILYIFFASTQQTWCSWRTG